jgi:DTW domain-containing protein YfiP
VSHPNALMALRHAALARSTKPFRARGSRLQRCEGCLMALQTCLCSLREPTAARSGFCFVMYPGEVFKPSNTGRLIADIIEEHAAFEWERTRCAPALSALLADPTWAPILVFPHAYADESRHIHAPEELERVRAGARPLFVMLDGTWREARKMFNSPWFSSLPVLGLQPDQPSRYLMRDAARDFQWSTAEVGAAVLRLAGDTGAALSVERYFAAFCERYHHVRTQLHDKDRSQRHATGHVVAINGHENADVIEERHRVAGRDRNGDDTP